MCTYVCFRCEAARFVFTELYWLYFDLTSLSIPAISCCTHQLANDVLAHGCQTFCNESISSAIGLSARYLTLFHWKVLRYWSTGSSVHVSQFSSSLPEIYAYCRLSSSAAVSSRRHRLTGTANYPPPCLPHSHKHCQAWLDHPLAAPAHLASQS